MSSVQVPLDAVSDRDPMVPYHYEAEHMPLTQVALTVVGELMDRNLCDPEPRGPSPERPVLTHNRYLTTQNNGTRYITTTSGMVRVDGAFVPLQTRVIAMRGRRIAHFELGSLEPVAIPLLDGTKRILGSLDRTFAGYCQSLLNES